VSDAPVLRLASASPRRRELLAQIGVPHSVTPAHIDEQWRSGEAPREHALRLARDKARAVWEGGGALPVLAADTVVALDGCIYGKPHDRAQALATLAALSGRAHTVLTAVALHSARGLSTCLSESRVTFRVLESAECEAYWETGEPRDKAGAYAIQGLGAVFVASVSGSYSGVVGLPLSETAALLRAAGVPYWVGSRAPGTAA